MNDHRKNNIMTENKNMLELTGTSITDGIVIGQLSFYREPWKNGDYASVTDTDAELARLDKAVEGAKIYIDEVRNKAENDIGAATATIFLAHRMMLEDPEYLGTMKQIIADEKMNCEYAIHKVSRHYKKVFASLGDEYMCGRTEDVDSLERYIWSNLDNVAAAGDIYYQEQEPRILASDEFIASELIRLDKSRVLGFVSARGSRTGHSAILTRNFGLPTVFGVGKKLTEEYNGCIAVIDGTEGKVYINPDEKLLAHMKMRRDKLIEARRSAEEKEKQGGYAYSRSGRTIGLYANVGIPDDLSSSFINEAQGIGLFRTEFLFCAWADLPDEETQFNAYKHAAELMGSKPVVIRTLDISGDKNLPYLENGWETNPELGFRGIRYSLSHPDVFKTQLRALLRAGVYGNIQIMFPMVSSPDEMVRARKIIEEVKNELTDEGVEFAPDVPVGIMIETPAAALLSDELAVLSDFFSVGTNDLAQYTLAVDRQNENLVEYVNDTSPAVLKLVEMTAKNAQKAGIPVAICGEIAGDLALTERFIDMGITGLSVAPARIVEIRRVIRELD